MLIWDVTTTYTFGSEESAFQIISIVVDNDEEMATALAWTYARINAHRTGLEIVDVYVSGGYPA